MQYFKGDDREKKFYESGRALTDTVSLQKDNFFSGAFSAAPLGDVIYDSGRSPLSNAITRDIFRNSFKQIFDAFTVAGSFESYISVFQKIFGTTSNVTFTVLAPGKLKIEIIADEVELSNFVARTILNDQYVFDEIVDHLGDNIISFQTVKGFKTQYELEQMLFEMVPAGVFTQIVLTIV